MVDQKRPTLSVIINNYNYERYLVASIDSLLNQGSEIEIIVVDDCSTDGSRQIISQYADKIIPVLQPYNQGQGAAFNAGFERATGDMVMFLDSDDFMLPGGAELIKDAYDPDVVIYHFRMRYADDVGGLAGIHPNLRQSLASGDISEKLRNYGAYDTTVTSGLVYARHALAKVLPMDGEIFRKAADGYLVSSVPLYGKSASSEETATAYRLHGRQQSKAKNDFVKRARWVLWHDEQRYAVIAEHSERLSLPFKKDFTEIDPYNSYNRMISLLFAPEQHPYPEDKVGPLIRRNRKMSVGTSLRGGSLGRYMFWLALGILPMPLKKTLVRLDISPAARPGWLKAIAQYRRQFLNARHT